MKKLMLTAAIVCAAVISQAASINWASGALNKAGSPGDDGPFLTGSTVYLINGSASDFFEDVIAEDFATAISYASVVDSATQGATSLSNPTTGTMSGTKDVITVDAGSYALFMTAIDDKGNVYISESKNLSLTAVGAKNASFTHDAAYEGTTFTMDAGYKGAGWYTAVPEPTSGLLLLLGMAGLALRRRRA